MICRWSHGNRVFEFDAISLAEEMQKVREIVKRYHWKIKDMKRGKG
jgi:hypothetical protein